MSTRRSKAIFGLGLVAFGLAVFLFASAYLVSRDQPKWLAATVGALAFPVLPVLWHVIGERRRRRLANDKAPPKKTSLSSGDRYLLRAFAVAAAVLAPMFVIGKFGVVRAAWDHKLWFLPADFDAIGTSDEMFAHVPAEADAVLVIREHGDREGAGIIAYGDHQLAMITPKQTDDDQSAQQLAQLNEQRTKIPFVKIDELSMVAMGNRVFAIATDRWKSAIKLEGAGPRAAIKHELAKAPANALIAMAYVPVKPQDGIEKISGWLLQKAVNEKLTVEGRVDAVDAAAAERVVTTTRALWNVQRSEVPATCRDEITKLMDAAELERQGAVITFHLAIQPEQLLQLMMCGMKTAKPDDDE